MKTANCPSCGAPVTFRSAASILAVCGYCSSTLIRHDLELENLGKMAQLLEDSSPLQLGAEGRYQGTHFAVIGRIQLQHEQGIWNEWFLLFDSQKNGWLSEASGSYVLTFQMPGAENLPPFEEIAPGQDLALNGQSYQVVSKESATCIAGEGELPFRVGAGYAAPVVDLSGNGRFATLDYSDGQPTLFVGEEVTLPALKMTGLRNREAGAAQTRARAFNCPACGAPQVIRAAGSESLACGSCGSVIDVSNDNFRLLSEYRGKLVAHTPLIPLGARGRLRGADYDVVGFMRRHVTLEGESYEWSEYLLYSEQENFRWLSEYQGHWNFIRPTTHAPAVSAALSKPRLRYLGREFVHFQTATASVSYVLGEFYWRVKVGESAEVMDFVAPPLMMSREMNGKEVTWSLGEYLEPEEIGNAFGLKSALPRPLGVYANQPSPYSGDTRRHWKSFAILAQIMLLIQIAFVFGSQNSTVHQQTLHFSSSGAEQLSTGPFAVTGRPSNLIIENRTNLDNDWLYLEMTLIETSTGVAYHMGREISYYHGYDGGEQWSEGNARDEAVLSEIPAGNYLLQIGAEVPPGRNFSATDHLRVKRDVPGWTNFFLALAGLLVFPVIAFWRSQSFETRRWAESDYTTDSSDDDNDDDGGDD